jgi:hypothetical protein
MFCLLVQYQIILNACRIKKVSSLKKYMQLRIMQTRSKKRFFLLQDLPSNETGIENRSLSFEASKYGSVV